jgi:hypothetical protein
MLTNTAMRTVAALAIITSLTGCGGEGGPTAPSPTPPTTTRFQQHASEHFTFHFTAMDAASIAATAALVEAEYSRIVADLGSPAVARVAVFLHPDTASLRPVLQGAGAQVSGATGLVTNATTVHVLSPNLMTAWSYDDGVRAIIHEFAHCASMHVNGSIPNNPRWLWEAVAVYESNDFVHPQMLPQIFNGAEPPSLARLNGFDNVDIYLVGYTIGEFIVERWGRAGLVSLIRNNGNLQPVTGLTTTQFFADWYSFVRARYLSTGS